MVKPVVILLVDDDPDDIEIFKEVVRKDIDSKINIITSRNGAECLAMLENITPDLIFLDINMPIMGGKECLEKIQSHEDYKDIPVVIYSTTVNKREIEYFIDQGASFLSKPVSFSNFITPLKTVLSKHIKV
jgi:CheY-like chemotaxis protein